MGRKQKEGDRLKLNTLFSTCIYITIVMFIFTVLLNFIMGLNLFSAISMPMGHTIAENDSLILQSITISREYTGGLVMENLWAVVLAGSVAGVILGILTHSTVFVGIYIFCFTFWSAYVNLLSIINIGGYLQGTMSGMVVAGTGAMILIFIGAIAGMTSGSG